MDKKHNEKEENRFAFQRRWPLTIMGKMTLQEYNLIKQVSGGDTYCHWIEHHTDILGRIKGYDSYKFGIYDRARGNPHKEERGTRADGDYSFKARYGQTKEEAFDKVKTLLLDVVRSAQNGQFDIIDAIDLDDRLKWKTAFIYADLNTLMPIYKAEKLKVIVVSLGGKGEVDMSSCAAMNRYVASLRPPDMSIYDYSHWLYHRLDEYVGKIKPLEYYIIGSKYGEHDNKDMLPSMRSAGVVSTDYGPLGLSLAAYYGDDNKEALRQYLEENGCQELNTANDQLYTFLNIRPGDLVAVKNRSYPKEGRGVLEIAMLAVVVECAGQVYSYDPVLGHCLQVQFIPYEGPRELPIGAYRSAVTRVVNESNRKVIFGQCAVQNSAQLAVVLNGPLRRAMESVNTGTSVRRAIGECTINRDHNRLQERFAAYLRETHGAEMVRMEENYVDIRLVEDSRITFYEVKKDFRPSRCIREALGQLLEYVYRHQGQKEIYCVVVGPVVANESDEAFVTYVQSKLNLKFSYLGFP